MIAERARLETTALVVIGVACALASSAAFWLHVLGFVHMPFFINFVGMPSIILVLILAVFSWHRRLSFWNRFCAGMVGGAVALAAYDGIRFGIYALDILEFYPFQTHRVFGSMITGQPAGTEAAAIIGWLYHFWNGFSFAIIYALIAGRAAWYWGVAWAMILEFAMLATYPTILDIKMNAAFVTMSLIGHTAYGVALGLTVSRMMRNAE
jgi:hypothetical protein